MKAQVNDWQTGARRQGMTVQVEAKKKGLITKFKRRGKGVLEVERGQEETK